MKKILFTGAFCAFFLTAAPVVIIPQNANLQEKTAAQELAFHLKLATGKSVTTVTENTPVKGKKIYLGNTLFAQKNKISFSGMGMEEHFVKAVSTDTLIIGGGHPRGTLYGVYEFLENNLNAMWLDEFNTKIDKVKTVVWKKDLQLRGKPAFAYRSIYNNFIKGSELYKIRNRQNAFHVKLDKKYDGYGISHIHGAPWFCHTFYFYTQDLAKEDYDILSMTNGKRVMSVNSAGPGQICYSNPKTAAHFIKKLKEWIPADRKNKEKWQYPVLYGLKTNDNRNECECKNCAALVKKHGWMGAKMLFVNKVASAFEKQYPDIYFYTDAYGLHGFPPGGGVKPNGNVTVDIAYGSGYKERPRDHFRPYSVPVNAISKKLHEEWASLTRTPAIWDYWVDCIRTRYPSNPIPTIAENLKFYKSLNTMYVMAECGGAYSTSLWRMRNIIGYRLLVNPDRDLDKEIKRFATAFYGKGAPYMLEFYNLLYRATMSLKENIQTYTLTNRYDLNEKFFADAERLLDAAGKATADDPLANERVNDERVAVEWAKIEKFKISDKKYIESFRKNVLRRMKYLSKYHAKGAAKSIDRLCQAALAALPALKGFENATLLADYGWPQLSLARYNEIIADPDAAGGKAAIPKSKGKTSTISCGVYDTRTRKYLIRGAQMPISAAPADGKYHWFYIGRCRLTADSLLYLHSSWTLQLPLAESMQGPEICDNDVAIYVSLKITGSAYAVDRVATVRGDISRKCPLPAPLPEGIDNKKLVAEISQIALTSPKVQDKSSPVRCAAPAGVLNNSGKLWCALRDSSGKLPAKAIMLAVPRDGKYHLKTLTSTLFTRGSLLLLGKIKIDLAGYNAMLKPDQAYEIKVSVKAEKNKNVLIDRIFISEK